MRLSSPRRERKRHGSVIMRTMISILPIPWPCLAIRMRRMTLMISCKICTRYSGLPLCCYRLRMTDDGWPRFENERACREKLIRRRRYISKPVLSDAHSHTLIQHTHKVIELIKCRPADLVFRTRSLATFRSRPVQPCVRGGIPIPCVQQRS